MTARSIALVAAFGSTLLCAEDFSLSEKGVGPITVHTALTYEGKGERLIASAVNDSGQAIPYVKLCVSAELKGCLFEMWNTEQWEAGGTLTWNVTTARHVPNLAHQVRIEVLNVPPTQTASPAPTPAAQQLAPVGSDVGTTKASQSATVQSHKPTPIPQGITLCLQPMAGAFDTFLTGEMQKQQVPVTIIATVPSADPTKPEACDAQKSLYTMTGAVVPEGKSFSARSIFGLRLHLRDEVQAAVKLVRNSDNSVVWAGDSDRGEAAKVAEHIVNQMLKQRPSWVPSPVNH
ncbi:MAG TPA: hypothetical protein VMU19_09500 [Bryobacteraceae bacterium]|nr:hypothetical protein [Bryobacteraceae bacterium]